VFTGETSNAKAKSSKNFLSPDQNWQNFGGFRCLGVRWHKKSFNFYSNRQSLSESASFKPFCATIG